MKSLYLILYNRLWIDYKNFQSVFAVLRSSHLTQWPKVAEFKKAICDYAEARFAVAVRSGTTQLHMRWLIAGLKERDEVITSGNTFAAYANSAVYCVVQPVFVDMYLEIYSSWFADYNKATNSHSRVVLSAHCAGQSCDMESICYIIK